MEIVIENVPKRFFVDGDYKFGFDDFLETVEALEDADGLMCRLVIYGKMEEYLEKKGIIFKNARGSCGCKDEEKRKELYEALYKLKWPETTKFDKEES